MGVAYTPVCRAMSPCSSTMDSMPRSNLRNDSASLRALLALKNSDEAHAAVVAANEVPHVFNVETGARAIRIEEMQGLRFPRARRPMPKRAAPMSGCWRSAGRMAGIEYCQS